jgi:hypothetical protein
MFHQMPTGRLLEPSGRAVWPFGLSGTADRSSWLCRAPEGFTRVFPGALQLGHYR